jgi:hypothetical protein
MIRVSETVSGIRRDQPARPKPLTIKTRLWNARNQGVLIPFLCGHYRICLATEFLFASRLPIAPNYLCGFSAIETVS